jgi:hypothetical protein
LSRVETHSSYGTHNGGLLPHVADAISGAHGGGIWEATVVARQLGVSSYSAARAHSEQRLVAGVVDGEFLRDDAEGFASGEDAGLGCSFYWGGRSAHPGVRLRDAQIEGAQNTRRGCGLLPPGAQEAPRHGPSPPRAAH